MLNPAPAEAKRPKVLIAEDDPISRRLLQSYLQKWGHEVVVAMLLVHCL